MKVTYSMINRDLRLPGRFFRIFHKFNYSLLKQIPGRYKNPYRLLRPDSSVIRMVIHRPKNQTERVPGILWLHGGGYCTGMPELINISMVKNAAKKCVIVAPDYTLSAIRPFPAALLDCYAALQWMINNADRLNIRTDQIFVGGDSAGGGLTVALCLYVRDNSNIQIACQMPLYPMIDDTLSTESMKDNEAPVWGEKQNKKAWKTYLRGLEKDSIPVYAAPAREENCAFLPPAISFVGGVDPFRDETVQYIEKLKVANIPVDFKIFEGCYHAFDMMVPMSVEAAEAKQFFEAALDNAIENYFAPQICI